MHRRKFLQTAGLVTLASAAGGLRYADQEGVFSVGQGPAFQPWKDWRNNGDRPELSLVRAALLAASPHNTQPWRFRIAPASIELLIDRHRNVGQLDPYLREEYIGMGCALENLTLAAPAIGFTATANLTPGTLSHRAHGPDVELAALIHLTPAPRHESELYRVIPRRHTNRGGYLPAQLPPPDFLEALRRLPNPNEKVKIFLFTSRAVRESIVGISAAANLTLYSDPDVQAANQRWIRLKPRDVQTLRDGLIVDAFGLPPMTAAIAKTLPTNLLGALVARGQKEGYSQRMLNAPIIGCIAVQDRYDREQCLQAGQVWQRAHLFATSRGVAARPSNEAMELIDYQRSQGNPARCLSQVAGILGDPAWQPTFMFLMGYAELPANASPRRSAGMVLGA